MPSGVASLLGLGGGHVGKCHTVRLPVLVLQLAPVTTVTVKHTLPAFLLHGAPWVTAMEKPAAEG